MYCSKAHGWQYDTGSDAWILVPLWVGVTDNLRTEILAGAKLGDTFVRQVIDKSEAGFSFKKALKLASPDNRSL
jgi:hypothetical protein